MRRWVHQIVVVRPKQVPGRLDGTRPDWAQATRTSAAGEFQRRSTSEVVEDRDARVQVAKLYLAPHVDIAGGDRVEHGGETWEVVGDPLLRLDGRGNEDHIDVDLRRVAG